MQHNYYPNDLIEFSLMAAFTAAARGVYEDYRFFTARTLEMLPDYFSMQDEQDWRLAQDMLSRLRRVDAFEISRELFLKRTNDLKPFFWNKMMWALENITDPEEVLRCKEMLPPPEKIDGMEDSERATVAEITIKTIGFQRFEDARTVDLLEACQHIEDFLKPFLLSDVPEEWPALLRKGYEAAGENLFHVPDSKFSKAAFELWEKTAALQPDIAKQALGEWHKFPGHDRDSVSYLADLMKIHSSGMFAPLNKATLEREMLEKIEKTGLLDLCRHVIPHAEYRDESASFYGKFSGSFHRLLLKEKTFGGFCEAVRHLASIPSVDSVFSHYAVQILKQWTDFTKARDPAGVLTVMTDEHLRKFVSGDILPNAARMTRDEFIRDIEQIGFKL